MEVSEGELIVELHIHAQTVNVYGTSADVEAALSRIETLVRNTNTKVVKMTPEMEAALRESRETGDAVDSIIVFNQALAQQLRDHADDPAHLRQLANDLDAMQNRIATSMVAGTPADPANTGGSTGTDIGTGTGSGGAGAGNAGGTGSPTTPGDVSSGPGTSEPGGPTNAPGAGETLSGDEPGVTDAPR